MFTDILSFNGRIRRIEYLLSLIFSVLINYGLYALILEYGISEEHPLLCIFYTLNLWFIYAQGAKRCHDRDNNGWYQIIPFYVLWMIFGNGDEGINEYGKPPKKQGSTLNKAVVIFNLLIVFLVIIMLLIIFLAILNHLGQNNLFWE